MELRKDYILNRWVIISENRAKRPSEFSIEKDVKRLYCSFCPGNEAQTPPETYKIEKDGKWQVRVIPNKFAAVDPKGDSLINTHNSYYTFAGDHGQHEVVIETPEHGKNFGDLPENEIADILKVYSKRIDELRNDSEIKYVCIFKNQGKSAGASIDHAHTQIISYAMIPPEIKDKTDSIKKYQHCPYCEIIAREKDSYRRCFENDSFLAFAPYASRFNYEVWIFPKEHILTFADFDDKKYRDMSSMLKIITQKLEKDNINYDIAYHYSPDKENLHFHVEVMPRIAIWAGFEVGFGITINTVSPETAAKFYRGEL